MFGDGFCEDLFLDFPRDRGKTEAARPEFFKILLLHFPFSTHMGFLLMKLLSKLIKNSISVTRGAFSTALDEPCRCIY